MRFRNSEAVRDRGEIDSVDVIFGALIGAGVAAIMISLPAQEGDSVIPANQMKVVEFSPAEGVSCIALGDNEANIFPSSAVCDFGG